MIDLLGLVSPVLAVGCALAAMYCARLVKRLAPYRQRWLRAVGLLQELDEEMRTEREYTDMLEMESARLLGVLEGQYGIVEEQKMRHAQEREERARRVTAIHQAIQREVEADRAKHRSKLERNLDVIVARSNRARGIR